MAQKAAKTRRPAERQLLSRREARTILGGISLPTLDKWIRKGRLDAIRLGAHRVFVTRSSVEHFIKHAEPVRWGNCLESFPEAEPLYVGMQAAERLTGLSGGQISRALKSGELPAFRVGKRIAIKVDDLTGWVERIRFRKGQH